MKMNLNCLYCGIALEPGSVEHIILSAIGGKKKTRTICCLECNNRLGSEIDRSLSEQLSLFAVQIGIVTGRGKDAAPLRGLESDKGYRINLQPGGKPEINRAHVKQITENEGKETIEIRARNEKEAVELLQGQLRRIGKDIKDIHVIKARRISEYVGSKIRLDLGSSEHFRAIEKMMLSYFGSKVKPQRLRSGEFEIAIRFINRGIKLPQGWINHDYKNDFPETEPIGDFDHRLIIFANDKEQIAYGLLELFGHLRFSGILSDKWSGPSLGQAYIIDPIESIHQEIKLAVPSSITRKSLLERKCSLDEIRSALDRLFTAIDYSQRRMLAENISERAMKDHFGPEGSLITKEMVNDLATELAEKFIQSFYRIDSEETFDIEEYFRKKNGGDTVE